MIVLVTVIPLQLTKVTVLTVVMAETVVASCPSVMVMVVTWAGIVMVTVVSSMMVMVVLACSERTEVRVASDVRVTVTSLVTVWISSFPLTVTVVVISLDSITVSAWLGATLATVCILAPATWELAPVTTLELALAP